MPPKKWENNDMRAPPTFVLADRLTAILPRNGSPIAALTASKVLRQHFPIDDNQFLAALALASARGDIVRMHAGAVLRRAVKRGVQPK
jgi:hypothetical protein